MLLSPFPRLYRKNKTIPADDLSRADVNGRVKDGAIENESVEFTVFTARVRLRRKIAEERFVQFAAGEAGIEDFAVHADSDGAESIGVKGADQLAGIPLPDGKEGRHPNALEILLAIGTEILQENVTEGDRLNAVFEVHAKRLFHARFVDWIDALRRDADFVKRQTDRLGLPLEKFAADAVHTDALVAFGYGGEERDDVNVAPLKQRVQGHSAVFAAAPAEENWFRAGH